MSATQLASGENVFLIPAEPAIYDGTVAEAVELPDDAPGGLGGEVVRLAGLPEGTRNETTFESMRPGDLLLFYRDDRYVGLGTVGATVLDADGWAGEALWDGAEAAYLFTVEEFAPIDVPDAAVNRIFDYDADYTPQGPMRVADSRVDASPRVIHLAVRRFSDQRS